MALSPGLIPLSRVTAAGFPSTALKPGQREALLLPSSRDDRVLLRFPHEAQSSEFFDRPTTAGLACVMSGECRAENRLDVHAYRCVGVAARNRKNNCVHRSLLRPVVTRRARDNSHQAVRFPEGPIFLQLEKLACSDRGALQRKLEHDSPEELACGGDIVEEAVA